MAMMVGCGSRSAPPLKVRCQRRLQRCCRIAIGKRIGEVLLPGRAVEALATAQRLLEGLLRTVDTEKTYRARAVELSTHRVSVGNGFIQSLHRSIRSPSNPHNGARRTISQRKECFGHSRLSSHLFEVRWIRASPF